MLQMTTRFLNMMHIQRRTWLSIRKKNIGLKYIFKICVSVVTDLMIEMSQCLTLCDCLSQRLDSGCCQTCTNLIMNKIENEKQYCKQNYGKRLKKEKELENIWR